MTTRELAEVSDMIHRDAMRKVDGPMCELMDCTSGASATHWHHLADDGAECMRICTACYFDLHGSADIMTNAIHGTRTPTMAASCPGCRKRY